MTCGWTVDTNVSWADYVKWVAERLSPEFSRRDAANGHAAFRRVLAGDVYDIGIAEKTNGSSGYDVTLTARPF